MKKWLSYIPKELHEEFAQEVIGEVPASQNIDRIRYVRDVMDSCAKVYQVNVEDMRDRKKRSRFVSDAKACATFIISRLGVPDDWISEQLGVVRSTISYRKRHFEGLLSVDDNAIKYYKAIMNDLRRKGYSIR